MLTMLTLAMLQAAPAQGCTYDRAAMLALDENAFDQDMTGGWRALEDRGCEREAADLIRDWRDAHPTGLQRREVSLWHEGQLRADIGQTDRAVRLFDQSRRPAAEDRIGWNHYVDGSIAFLRHDRTAFDAAYAKLAALPKPPDFDATMKGPGGKPVTIAWPMNLNVLAGLRRCWGRPYKVAYGATCAKPMFRYSTPDKQPDR